jgi:hypothetical protein
MRTRPATNKARTYTQTQRPEIAAVKATSLYPTTLLVAMGYMRCERLEHIKNKLWRPALFYEKPKPASAARLPVGRDQLKPREPRRPINGSEDLVWIALRRCAPSQ